MHDYDDAVYATTDALDALNDYRETGSANESTAKRSESPKPLAIHGHNPGKWTPRPDRWMNGICELADDLAEAVGGLLDSQVQIDRSGEGRSMHDYDDAVYATTDALDALNDYRETDPANNPSREQRLSTEPNPK